MNAAVNGSQHFSRCKMAAMGIVQRAQLPLSISKLQVDRTNYAPLDFLHSNEYKYRPLASSELFCLASRTLYNCFRGSV